MPELVELRVALTHAPLATSKTNDNLVGCVPAFSKEYIGSDTEQHRRASTREQRGGYILTHHAS